MNIRDLSFVDIINMPIPCEVYDNAIRKVATYRLHMPGGGSGMGEYPASALLVLNDGTVYLWDAWNSKREKVSKSFPKGNF